MCTSVLISPYRDTGHPKRGFGAVLPRHHPEHDKQHMETTNRADYKPPYPYVPVPVSKSFYDGCASAKKVFKKKGGGRESPSWSLSITHEWELLYLQLLSFLTSANQFLSVLVSLFLRKPHILCINKCYYLINTQHLQ